MTLLRFKKVVMLIIYIISFKLKYINSTNRYMYLWELMCVQSRDKLDHYYHIHVSDADLYSIDLTQTVHITLHFRSTHLFPLVHRRWMGLHLLKDLAKSSGDFCLGFSWICLCLSCSSYNCIMKISRSE